MRRAAELWHEACKPTIWTPLFPEQMFAPVELALYVAGASGVVGFIAWACSVWP